MSSQGCVNAEIQPNVSCALDFSLIAMPDQTEAVVEKLAELLDYSQNEFGRLKVGDGSELGAKSANTRWCLEPERFHRYDQSAPPWRTLAVDASLKSVLDCGAFLVVLTKIAFEVWQLGSRRAKEGIVSEVQIFRSLETARQKMAVLEFELAQKASQYLSEGDVTLLDRPLCLRRKSLPILRQSMEALISSLIQRKIGLVGVCKSSRLQVEGGAPLIGYLLHHAHKMGIRERWFYYPLQESPAHATLQIGQLCAASLNPAEDFAFRIDLGPNQTNLEDAARILGSVSSLGDRFAYGYPYPLRSVHEACSISRTEVDICRQRLLEAASRRGISGNLRYALKATSFREEVLLS